MVSMGPKTLLACLLLTAVALGGCSGGGGSADPDAGALADDAPEIEATSTTGGIRGIVVDDAIRPIKGATVEVLSTDKKAETDETGLFVFSGLEAGTYFVKASQPLYAGAQQSVEVVAGVADPAPVKFLLSRVVLANPYMTTEKFDGYIVCSAGQADVGYSEECGEGVGVPCLDPSVPCGRQGGQGNNQVQYDFTVENLGLKTIVVELAWEPTSEAGKELLTYVSTKWVCDPFCGGNTFVNGGGPSPLLLRAEADNGTIGDEKFNTTEPFTVFTWANPYGKDPTGTADVPTLVLNQGYQVFVTKSYYLALPEGWSFIAGGTNPF
jgi:Carboxypeptidase regulatory-like domain